MLFTTAPSRRGETKENQFLYTATFNTSSIRKSKPCFLFVLTNIYVYKYNIYKNKTYKNSISPWDN